MRKEELQMQRDMRQQELEIRRQEREEDLDRQRQRNELELQRREEKNQRRDKENEIREIELQRQRAKDEAERKRQESMARQTRFYGEAFIKHSLPKMGLDPIEFPSYFASVENLFSLYEVPPQLQSKLLIPMLNERSKSLLAKLPKERLDKYVEVRDYLLREFKLTAEQYRERFRTAVNCLTQTYTLFGSRVKNLFLYYFAKSEG